MFLFSWTFISSVRFSAFYKCLTYVFFFCSACFILLLESVVWCPFSFGRFSACFLQVLLLFHSFSLNANFNYMCIVVCLCISCDFYSFFLLSMCLYVDIIYSAIFQFLNPVSVLSFQQFITFLNFN